MLAQLKSWLIGTWIVLITLAPLVWAAPSSELVLTFAVLAIDICGVAVARRYFAGPGSIAATHRSGVDRKKSVIEASWRWAVHAIGMGFGISAVLVVGYLAYLLEF